MPTLAKHKFSILRVVCVFHAFTFGEDLAFAFEDDLAFTFEEVGL